MEALQAILSNPWLGIFGLTLKSDDYHPSGAGYAVATGAILVLGIVLGRLSERVGRRDDIRPNERIEPRL